MEALPTFHDGLLLGITLLDKGDKRGRVRDVRLSIRDVKGTEFILILREVTDLLVDGFREGNIILDITVSNALIEWKQEIARLVFFDDDPESDRLNRFIESNSDGTLQILCIDSSYGASVLALFRDFQLCDASIHNP